MNAFGSIGKWAVGSADSVLRQWNHSIVHEPWFVSVWEASEKAIAFHMEIQPQALQLPNVPVWQGLGIAVYYRAKGKFQTSRSWFGMQMKLTIGSRIPRVRFGIDRFFLIMMLTVLSKVVKMFPRFR